jgi:hypothetical protein
MASNLLMFLQTNLEKFLSLVQVGRLYLQIVSSEMYDASWTSVEVCLALNNSCSTQRGARKSATFMELLPLSTLARNFYTSYLKFFFSLLVGGN